VSTGAVSAFNPIATLTFTQTTSAQTATITPCDSALVFNNSAGVAFVSFGGVATSASTPVPAGMRQLFSVGACCTNVSVLSASAGTGSIYVTSGLGTAY
jgi:hypothetical protein